jgi:hypothetical protein
MNSAICRAASIRFRSSLGLSVTPRTSPNENSRPSTASVCNNAFSAEGSRSIRAASTLCTVAATPRSLASGRTRASCRKCAGLRVQATDACLSKRYHQRTRHYAGRPKTLDFSAFSEFSVGTAKPVWFFVAQFPAFQFPYQCCLPVSLWTGPATVRRVLSSGARAAPSC